LNLSRLLLICANELNDGLPEWHKKQAKNQNESNAFLAEVPAGVVMFNSGRDEFLEKKIGGKRGRGEEPMLRTRFFAPAFHQSWVR
jgi:hypothetical protein